MDVFDSAFSSAEVILSRSDGVAGSLSTVFIEGCDQNDSNDVELNLDAIFHGSNSQPSNTKPKQNVKKPKATVGKPSKKSQSNRNTLSKPYKCDTCSDSFNVLGNLSLHKIVHGDPPFACHCEKVFSRCSSYLGHIKTHFQNEHFRCKFCSQKFAYYSLYEHHLRAAHQDSHAYDLSERKLKSKSTQLVQKPRQYPCGTCKKIFNRASSMRRHERIHGNERPYECHVCHQRFHQPGSLKTHQLIHLGAKPFLCEYCLRRFSQKGNLNLHIQRCHLTGDGKGRFSCMHCLCSFGKLSSLQTHMTKAHAITDSDRKRNDHDYEIQNEIKEVMKHLAEIQDAVLPTIDSHPTDVLDDHQYMDLSFAPKNRVHSGDSLNRKMFFDRSAEYVTLVDEDHQHKGKLVQRLVRQVFRDGLRWLVCKYCPKEFRRPSDLMRHFRIHTKERPFQCTMCNRAFSVRTTLTVHMRTHTKDPTKKKPKYQRCPNCLQVFDSGISLNDHECPKSNSNQPEIIITDDLKNLIDRNVPTDDLASFCDEIELNGREMTDICNEIIPEVPEHLADHASPAELKYFQCNLCPSIFKRKCHLNEHLVVHAGIKTLQCDVCMKFYAKKSVLRRHKLIHERKMPCKTCDMEFTTLEDLKEHSLLHLAEISDRNKPDISAEILEDNHQAALADLQEIIASESQTSGRSPGLNESETSSVSEYPTLNAFPPLDDHNYNSTFILNENTGLFAVDPSSVVGVAVNDNQLDPLEDDHQYFLILDGNADRLIFSDLDENEAHQIGSTFEDIEEGQIASQTDSPMIEFSATPENVEKIDDISQSDADVEKNCETWIMPGIESEHVEIIEAETLAIWQKPTPAPQFTDNSLQFVHLESLTDNGDGVSNSIPNISVVKVSQSQKKSDVVASAPIAEKENSNQSNNKKSYAERNLCHICNRKFKKPIDYRRHMRTHTGERPFSCNICSRSFSLRCILLTHMKRHNDKKEKHTCHVCQKNFSAKGSLTVHLRLHTGAKPFPCQYCDLKFRTSGHRTAHELCHIKQAAKKKIDPAQVKTRKGKSKLRSIEDAVNVSLNEEKRRVGCKLATSQKVHSNSKNGTVKEKKSPAKVNISYACPSCSKSFRKRSLLLRHLVVHTQERKFSCTVCGNSFTQKATLTTHSKRCHPEAK